MKARTSMSTARWVLALWLVLAPGAWAAAEAGKAEVGKGDSAHGEESEHDSHESEHDGHGKGGHGHSSRLSDVARPLDISNMPERPRPPIELGEPFLGTGTLDPGFQLPTGAVWQPSLLVFGTWRTAVQSFESDDGSGRITELATRLDLFFQPEPVGQ